MENHCLSEALEWVVSGILSDRDRGWGRTRYVINTTIQAMKPLIVVMLVNLSEH